MSVIEKTYDAEKKAKMVLGYEPLVTLSEAIESTGRSFAEVKDKRL